MTPRHTFRLVTLIGLLIPAAFVIALLTTDYSERTVVHAQTGRVGFAHQVWSVGSGGTTQPTVPAGTSFCTFAVTVNAINYWPDTSAPAPTTSSGIPALTGSIFQLDNFFNCQNLTAIAQAGTATIYVEFWR